MRKLRKLVGEAIRVTVCRHGVRGSVCGKARLGFPVATRGIHKRTEQHCIPGHRSNRCFRCTLFHTSGKTCHRFGLTFWTSTANPNSVGSSSDLATLIIKSCWDAGHVLISGFWDLLRARVQALHLCVSNLRGKAVLFLAKPHMHSLQHVFGVRCH